MITCRRDIVLQHTRPQRLPFLPEVRLYLADEIAPLWRKVEAMGEQGLPYWAFAWVGGQALARYVLDHRQDVAGRRVLDFASGSGLCAIAAMRAGAASALAADIDAFSKEAVELNATLNGVSVSFTRTDLLDVDLEDVDVVLAGDIWYERTPAVRALPWLSSLHRRGAHILLGDPGRRYFPGDGLVRLADYEVPTTRELEDSEVKLTGVFSFSRVHSPT